MSPDAPDAARGRRSDPVQTTSRQAKKVRGDLTTGVGQRTDLAQLSPEARAFCNGCVQRALVALGQLDGLDELDEATACELIQEAIDQLVLLFAEHDLAADR